MDSNFVDLDIIATRIREPGSKPYFLDAVKAYKAGALRAALSSTWVAVVYDLIMKYRELSALGDPGATAFLRAWDVATANDDRKKLVNLETDIIKDATTKTQILNPIAKIQLDRLREDRNLCAHPAFSTEADLFEPLPEMVRLHLVNAIELILSQAPLQGKAVLERFSVDVQSAGFPTDRSKIRDYVEQRYLNQTRPQNVNNLGIVLAKSLLKGIPPEWEDSRQKVIASLIAVRECAPRAWLDISASIVRIMNSLEPEERTRAIGFLAGFPDFWRQLDDPTQTALREIVKNTAPSDLTDYRLLAGVRLPEFRDHLLNLLEGLPSDQLRKALNQEVLPELWTRSLQCYADSGSFRGSEENFHDFILPFSGKLCSAQLDGLLEAVVENGQNWDASGTPSLLKALLKNTSSTDFPSSQGRDKFFHFLARGRDDPFTSSPLYHYEEVIHWLQTDGWMPPESRAEEEE